MFINETPFDDKLIKAMGVRYHLYIYRYTVGISLLSAVVSFFGFINQNLVSGIVFALIAFLIPLAFHVVLPLVLRAKNKEALAQNALPSEPIIQTFTFNDDHFLITTSNRQGYAPLSNPYTTIMNLAKTRKYIIIDAILEQDNQKVSLALLKSGMIVGEAKALYTFLQTKLGKGKPR